MPPGKGSSLTPEGLLGGNESASEGVSDSSPSSERRVYFGTVLGPATTGQGGAIIAAAQPRTRPGAGSGRAWAVISEVLEKGEDYAHALLFVLMPPNGRKHDQSGFRHYCRKAVTVEGGEKADAYHLCCNTLICVRIRQTSAHFYGDCRGNNGHKHKETSMRSMPVSALIISIPLACFLGFGCSDSEDSGSVVATETWDGETTDSAGTGHFTFIKMSDGSIAADGEWRFGATVCPFADGPATVSGSAVSFTASGTATDPSGTSGFTLAINGNASGGHASGSYSITFNASGWGQRGSPNWNASRTSGSGITE